MAEFVNTIDVLGDDVVIDSIIDRSITEFKDNAITTIGDRAFSGCDKLASIAFPNVTSWAGHYQSASAFYGCNSITELTDEQFPALTAITASAFRSCKGLKTVSLTNVVDLSWYGLADTSLDVINLPNLRTIGMNGGFAGSSNLKQLIFPALKRIDNYGFEGYPHLEYFDCASTSGEAMVINGSTRVFNNATGLKAFIIRSSTVANLAAACFNNTPIASGVGHIYVPRALVDSYKAATNWSTYADQFRALEDYTIDGTITGKIPTECDSISLNVSELNLTDTAPYTLIATTTPNWFIGKYISWMTNNPYVAIIRDGVITAVGDGVATITATCGEHSATCTVSVSGVGAGKPPTLYSLPQETNFNGTSDYIDTGIKLFDNPKDFTIFCDATFDKLTTNKCLFHCMNEASGYPGISVDGNNGVRIAYTTGTVSLGNVSNVKSLGIRYVNGLLERIMYKNTSGNIITATISGTPKYTAIPQNLLLGAYQDTAGTKGRYFQGTIYAFDVFDFAISDDDIAYILSMR